VGHVSLDEIADDATFRLRAEGDVGELAASIGRLGQLAPLELRPLPGAAGARRYQVLSGFRRLAALRLLQRERALARVHEGLSDADAWALALGGPLFAEAWSPADLDGLAGRVREHLPWALPALQALQGRAAGKGGGAPAASSAPVVPPPAGSPPAADPAAFAHQLAVKAYELNQEMAAAYEAWGSLPRDGRALVLEQVRYLARLLTLLEREP
jgi:ParB-like chromosome segregation protein Spo0J